MEAISGFFIKLSAYTVPIAILLAEVLAGILLLGGFRQLKWRQKRSCMETEDERLFYSIVPQLQQDIQILIRREDLYPLYAAGDLTGLLGLKLTDIQEDIGKLTGLLEQKAGRAFWKAYRAWDGTVPLQGEMSRLQGADCIQISIFRDEKGTYDYFCFRDITRERQERSGLEERLAKAENASEYKTRFLSRMSHEIRTPMNGIIGMLTLAKDQLQQGDQAFCYLEKAEGLFQHLLSLINDILDLSRIEANKVELEKKEFDLVALSEKLTSMFQKNIEAKGVHFVMEMLDFDVRYVIGDELRISQVLINFLSNASKFTHEGEIRVTFRQMLKEQDKVDMMIRIHDTGIGMEPQFLSRIFQPYEQENADITKKYGGSGLGMAIADQIVRLMGGEITVDSMPGKGSDFAIFLQLPYVEAHQTVEKQEAEDLKRAAIDRNFYEGLRILMAEDNEINAEIAKKILERSGATVDIAPDGKQAVDRFEANPPGYYGVILMDIQMPVLNGLEAARRIRSLKRPDARQIPIFALSADAFVEDKRRSVQAGMNGHFSKPIDFGELNQAIGQFLSREEAQEERLL